MIVKINDKNYNIVVGNNPLKKYDVYRSNKKIFSFGAKGYEHYKDRIGYYKDYDHLDKKRRELYYKRHNKKYDIISPDGFAKMFLW